MLHFDETPPKKARIEIIPMIDVMMFLLIFFVLISLNVIPAFGLKTALPDSSTAQRTVSDSQPIVVSLRRRRLRSPSMARACRRTSSGRPSSRRTGRIRRSVSSSAPTRP